MEIDSLTLKRIDKIKNNWSQEEINLAFKALYNMDVEKEISGTKMEAVLFDNSYFNAIQYIFSKNKLN